MALKVIFTFIWETFDDLCVSIKTVERQQQSILAAVEANLLRGGEAKQMDQRIKVSEVTTTPSTALSLHHYI